MSKAPAFQLYTGDWLKDPRLSMCSPSTRGIWIDLICAMHEADRSGQIVGNREQLARLCRCTAVEISNAIAELESTGAATVTERNGIVTLTNRRMKREASTRENIKKRVKKHRGAGYRDGNPKNDDDETADVTPVKRESNTASSSSSSTSVTLSRSGAGANAPPLDKQTVIEYGRIHGIPEAECELWWQMRGADDFHKPFSARDGTVIMRPILNWQQDLSHQFSRGNLKPKPEPNRNATAGTKPKTRFERSVAVAHGVRDHRSPNQG